MYESYARSPISIWKALYLYRTPTPRTPAIKPPSGVLALAPAYPHPLPYILTRTIEHREPPREPCHPRGLDLLLDQDDRAYPTTA